jgi:hypothetical protein
VSVETPDDLFVRGSILRGIIADRTSPIVYGYAGDQLPVYFSQSPVLNAGGGGGRGFGGRGGGASFGPDITPMATRLQLSPWDQDEVGGDAAGNRTRGRTRGAAQGTNQRAAFQQLARARGVSAADGRPRVVMRFPADPKDMLLSGVLSGGENLSNRAQVVDDPMGDGHVVMFAIRPYWRWQTQGTFFLGFNAILNWNDLDAGRTAPQRQTTEEQRR